MAKLEQGILGPFRGTVGTVIGYRWRDRWCMRARPHSYNDRRSAAQLAQRSRFKAMIQFASPATPLLRLGLKAWAAEHGLTEGNAFLRLNHPHFLNNQNVLNNQNNQNNQNIPNNLNNLNIQNTPNILNNQNTPIAYPLLQFSHGSLPPVEGAVAERVDALTVRVGWQRGLGRSADQVHLYAYCPAATTGLAVAAVERGRRQAQFILPQEFAGEEIHLWAFVVNAEGVASATRYVPLAGGLENLENLERLENLENLDNPATAGNKEPKASKQPRATAPQLQLALDFGAPPD